MHDVRNVVGYRRLPVSDQTESDLRDQWYKAKKEWDDNGRPDTGPVSQHFNHVDERLSSYLWSRAVEQREEDRRKHPKAKRNLPVPPRDSDTPARVIE